MIPSYKYKRTYPVTQAKAGLWNVNELLNSLLATKRIKLAKGGFAKETFVFHTRTGIITAKLQHCSPTLVLVTGTRADTIHSPREYWAIEYTALPDAKGKLKKTLTTYNTDILITSR